MVDKRIGLHLKRLLRLLYIVTVLCCSVSAARSQRDNDDETTDSSNDEHYDVEFPYSGKSSIKFERTLQPDVSMQNLTFCFWLKPMHFKGDVITYYVVDSAEFKIEMDGQAMHFKLRGKDTIFPSLLSRNNWNLICFRFDVSEESVVHFLNGQQVSKQENKSAVSSKERLRENISSIIKASGKLIIGYDLYSRKDSFQGSISKVGLWKRGLSNSEIAEQMSCYSEEGDVIGWSNMNWIFEFGSPRRLLSTIPCVS